MVKCELCGRKLRLVNANHLRSAHNIETIEYLTMFPEALLGDDEFSQRVKENMPLFGEEILQKMSIANSGQTRTEEQRKNISEGVSAGMTEDVRRRISEKLAGHEVSEETRQRIVEGCNKAVTVEKRQQLSRSLTGNQNALGHTLSAEGRQSCSEGLKAVWEDSERRDIMLKNMQESWHLRPTQPELYVQKTLDKHFPGEWEYTGDGRVWLDGRNPDFMNVNGKKQVLEVFGMFWHEESEEAERTAHYKKLGFDCLVIWEYDTLDEDLIVEGIKNLGT